MKINQINEENNRDGYWQMYWANGNLFFKGHYDNGVMIGYWECYHGNGNLLYKGNYDNNGKLHGYWEWYYDNGKLEEQIFYS